MIVLGIWDGHNASASLVENGKLVAAVNEERFTKRKLEPNFPINSIKYCLGVLKLRPKDITHVAMSTSDWSMTLSRLMSGVKSDFWYKRRRHLTNKPITWDLDLQILNQTGKIKSNVFFRKISRYTLKKYLSSVGFNMKTVKLHLVDHHKAHAASAFFTSGLKKATCITLDALGDGYSSTVNICENNEIETISKNTTKDSLGLFFQEVTSIMGMRILEDEGKVMALSDFAYVEKNFKNPMKKFFEVKGTKIKSKIPLYKRYNLLKKLHWRNKPEKFAYMAQSALEEATTQFFDNAINNTGIKDVVWAGGISSNIKMNMNIRQLKNVNNWHIFPDMGDGGLSAGAALFVSNKLYGTKSYRIQNVYLGPEYNDDNTKNILRKYKNKLEYEKISDKSGFASDLITNDEIVFWHQGKGEFGPRALGNRSILASASSVDVKNKLNMNIKRRSYYQPFCPSILWSDAKKFIKEKEKDFNKYMVMGYNVKESMENFSRSVMNVDKSIRPQMVGEENKLYMNLLKGIKKKSGYGILLNTSFNIHGNPIVLDPKDAIKTQIETKNPHLFVGDYYVHLK
jgi:carbamoyltransferase